MTSSSDGLTTQSVFYSRTDNLADCPTTTVAWEAESKTIEDSESSYTDRNLFDLSRRQWVFVNDPADACRAITPGVSVRNGDTTARY